VRHSIQEAVLPFISTDFANDEDGVDDQAGDNHTEKDNAQNKRHDLPPMEHDPGDIKEDRESN
jgi:hypothetical protein